MMHRIKFQQILELMNSYDPHDRLVAQYVSLKRWYESLKLYNTRVEADLITRSASFKEESKIPNSFCRDMQMHIGHLLHDIELAAVIEDVDLEDAVWYLIEHADAERSEAAERYDKPVDENSDEREFDIISLEETIRLFEVCRMPGPDIRCEDCKLRDAGCGMALDKNALNYLKEYGKLKKL